MLRDIQRYIQERKNCSLTDISLRFRMDKLAAKGIVDRLVLKGKVEEILPPSCASGCASGGCSGCGVPEINYKWSGELG